MKTIALPLVLTLILICCVVSLGGCKKAVIGAEEAGVILKKDGSYSLVNAGETRYYLPFYQRVITIPLKPTLIKFTDEEGMPLFAPGKNDIIESQLSYVIQDLPRAVASFGISEIHNQIRKILKEELTETMKQQISAASALDDPGKRVAITAQIHFTLNNSFAARGVEITGFQLRVR